MQYIDKAIRIMVSQENQQIYTHTNLLESTISPENTFQPIKEKQKEKQSKSEIDNTLKLKGKIINYLSTQGKDISMSFSKRTILDIIKIVEGLTDDRPAKDRLNLLISNNHCIQLDTGKKMTTLIKFNNTDSYGVNQQEQPASQSNDQYQQQKNQKQNQKENEDHAILANYGDLR